jgi:hypothetical protein
MVHHVGRLAVPTVAVTFNANSMKDKTMAQSTLLDGQELYTPALVRARLANEGDFNARSFTTGKLLEVTAIDGSLVTVYFAGTDVKFHMDAHKIKSL